ncbi:MAG: F0F1 ATP synthase subunit B [Myxococcota bacterium]|nr:F0F1 ATP synthase subunit B [Myxococcota bacterium]
MRYLYTFMAVHVVFMPIAMAAGGEAKTGWDAWSTVFWHTVNFIILVGLLVKLGGPPVRAALQGRSNRISKEIDEAAKLHTDAEAMLNDYKTRFAEFEAESKRILEESRALGEAERARIIKEAEAEAERIKSEAGRIVASDRQRAIEKLEGEIVDMAIARAEERIKAQMTDDDHHALVRDYFGQLESSIERN